MAQQDIKVTVVGDTLPLGGAKINANFAEVRAELVVAEAAATTAANVAAQASADAGAATAAVATATADAAAAVAAVAAATAASDAAVAAVTAATANNAVTDAKLRDSAAVSVIGRSANSSGDPADIAAGSNDQVLARVSNALAFQQLTVGMVPNDLITYAKLQNVANTSRILGRITSGAGDVEELTGTQLTTLLDPFTSTLQGLAPPSGGGTSAYLRADGIWSAPPTGVSASNVLYADQQSGIDNDGVIDCTAALNTIGAASRTFPVQLVFTPGDYLITDTVTFSSGSVAIWIMSGARILYNGTATKPALVFGVSTTTTTLSFNCEGEIRASVSHGWTNLAFVGVRFIRIKQQYIRIMKVYGFTVNVQLYGSSTLGIEQNHFFIQSFDAKYHVNLQIAIDGGFINENLFEIAAQTTATYTTTLDSYGLVYNASSGGVTVRSCNQNVLLKPSFQLADGTGGATRMPIWHDGVGTNNRGYAGRVEGGIAAACVLIDGTTYELTGNDYEFTYFSNATFTKNLSELGYTHENRLRLPTLIAESSQTWQSGPLIERAFCPASGTIAIKGLFIQNTASATEARSETGKIFKDAIPTTTNRAIGVWVDTSYYKSFSVVVDAVGAGRIRVACYDVDGALLDAGSANAPHANAGTGFTGSAAYGYVYTAGSDTTTPTTFRVGDHVKSIKVLLYGSTNTRLIKSFSITGFASEVSPKPLRVYGGVFSSDYQFSSSSPGTLRNGWYSNAGNVSRHSAPTAGQPQGWACNAAGWNASAWIAATAYVVNQMVENDTGKVYVCLTAGTSAGSGGPTGTATSGITDNTVVWGYIGTLATWIADIGGQSSITQGDLLYGSAADTVNKLAKDTNATRSLTNTGSSNSPAWAQVALSTGVSGTLPETSGGTGQSTITQGDLLYGSAANTISVLAKNASATRSLTNTGASNSPAWAQVALATGVSGTLPETNGGTGQSTLTQGDILYASAANTVSKLAKSATATHALLNTGTTNNPAWGQVPLASGVSGVVPLENGGASFVRLSGDLTALGTTYTDVTGLSFSILANETYEFEFVMKADADATTTGIDVAVNGPASPTSIQYTQQLWSSTTVMVDRVSVAYDDDTASSGSPGVANRTYRVKGVIQNGANAGTLAARIKREAVGTGPNVRAGSYGVLRRIA